MAAALRFMLLTSVGLLASSVNANSFDDCCVTCPTMWTQSGERCYLFHLKQLSWIEAEKQCIEEGGNLASIRDDKEYAFVKKLIQTMAGKMIPSWVGGHDAVEEKEWQWSDGSKFTFKNWGNQQPNNIGSNEHCLGLFHLGKDFTVDDKCSELRAFLCTMDL